MTTDIARMRYVVLAVMSGALACSVAVAAERLPTFPKNTEYGEARRSLLALGWEPVTMPGADKCEADDYRCHGRSEMSWCSGTGRARCGFSWRQGGRLIEVETYGEDPAYAERVRCRAGC